MNENKKEFNKWVDDVIRNKYKKDTNCAVVFNEAKGKTIVVDTNNYKMAVAKCHKDDTFNNNIGFAIAYARLRGIPIPEVSEEPQRWRAKYKEIYYTISPYFLTSSDLESNDCVDDNRFKAGSYFKTSKQAEVIAEKIRYLIKLYQYKLMYDADYEPDWSVSNPNYKYYIYFDVEMNKYSYGFCNYFRVEERVYFSSMEVALKICDILNKELANGKCSD